MPHKNYADKLAYMRRYAQTPRAQELRRQARARWAAKVKGTATPRNAKSHGPVALHEAINHWRN